MAKEREPAWGEEMSRAQARALSAGELVHVMLVNYQAGLEEHGCYMQNQTYFEAAQRLDELSLLADSPDE